MGRQTYALSDISEIMGLPSEGHRALRLAAERGALGPAVSRYARANRWHSEAVYRAMLFMVLHSRVGIAAVTAAEMVRDTPGFEGAVAAVRGGERWRFEVQHVTRELVPVCDYAPWSAARSGLSTGEPPVARTIVDLAQAWGWIAAQVEE